MTACFGRLAKLLIRSSWKLYVLMISPSEQQRLALGYMLKLSHMTGLHEVWELDGLGLPLAELDQGAKKQNFKCQ